MTGPIDTPGANLGGKVAGRIASVVVQAALQAKAQSGGHVANVAQTVLRDFTNHVSDEIRSTMGPLWTKFAQDEDTPELLRPTFQALSSETGQAWGLIGGLASSSVLSTGLLDGISNEFAPVIQKWIGAIPNARLSPADAAMAEVRSMKNGLDTAYEAATQGINNQRYNVLVELARSRLTAGEVIDALRLGLINRANAETDLIRLGYQASDVAVILGTLAVPLSPADAAAGWARNSLTIDQTDTIGAKSGISKGDMAVLRDLAGEPPSIEDLLFAWRRGIITEKDVDRGIVQGPIRNEWIPVVKALQWNPLPVAEAADAVNQGHLALDAARKVAAQSGVKADDFDVIINNAGIPPGPQEALDWVNRGLITEAQFRSIFLESRIKNKYIDLYLRSRFEVMPPETVRLMYSRGALSKEDALHRLQQRGYTPEDAAIVIDGASADKTTKTRDLTVTQVLSLRADGLISSDAALAMLQAAGYDAEEALWVTELADLQRVRAFVAAAINRTKASYVAGRLSEVDASGVLDSLGLPADYKDQAFALWDLERTTVTKGLTPAQIVSAVKKGVIDRDGGLARLVGQGYAQEDAQVLLIIGGAVSSPTQQGG
jgi:hypothetical protein